MDITQNMLKSHKMGWAHVDTVLTTGGASRMPMVRAALKDLSGRTLNTTLVARSLHLSRRSFLRGHAAVAEQGQQDDSNSQSLRAPRR